MSKRTRIVSILLIVCMFCTMFALTSGAATDSSNASNAVIEYDGIYKLKHYSTGTYLSYKNGSVGTYIPGVGTSSEINQLWRVTYFMTVGGNQVWYTIRPMADLDNLLIFDYDKTLHFRNQPEDTPGEIADRDMWIFTKNANGRFYVQNRFYQAGATEIYYPYLHINNNFTATCRYQNPSEWILTKVD